MSDRAKKWVLVMASIAAISGFVSCAAFGEVLGKPLEGKAVGAILSGLVFSVLKAR